MPTTIENTTVSTSTIIEPETGIFEYTTPQEMDLEEWLESHIECDAIMEHVDSSRLRVYAFTRSPKYNRLLMSYRKRKYGNLRILKGVSENAIGSLV